MVRLSSYLRLDLPGSSMGQHAFARIYFSFSACASLRVGRDLILSLSLQTLPAGSFDGLTSLTTL